MIYGDGVPMDSDGRVIICPRCSNQDFEYNSDYCQICGLSLFNACTENPTHKNRSNARFCKVCGKPTSFFHANLLVPYDVVLERGYAEMPHLNFTDNPDDRYAALVAVTGNRLYTAEDVEEFGLIYQYETDNELPF